MALGLLVVLSLLAVTFFGEPIARSVVAALNDRLQANFSIDEYGVRLWATFPNLSVHLTGVEVAGSDGSRLLVAEGVSFQLPLSSLWDKIRVDRVVIHDGQLQLLSDADGNTNYQLTGYTPVGEQLATNSSPTKPTEFAIDGAGFTDVDLIYRDAQLGIDMVGNLEDLSFSGDFGATNYLLSTTGTVLIDHLDQGGDRYAYRQRLRLDASTEVNQQTGVYTLAPLYVAAGDLELNVAGTIQPTLDGLTADLRVESESGSLEDVIKLIPPAHAGTLSNLDTEGSLELAATVRGDWTEQAYPRIEGLLNFTDGRVGSPRINVGVKDLNLRAVFTYLDGPRGGVQTFEVRELTGTHRGEAFRAQLLVEDVTNPEITFEANGAFALETLPALVREGVVEGGDGLLRMEGVRIEGRYEDMLTPRGMGRVQATGRVMAEGAEVVLPGGTVAFPAGALEFRGNTLALRDLEMTAPGTAVQFSGAAVNLIPVLFADSLNTKDAELQFTAALTGQRLDLTAILGLLRTEEQSVTGSLDTSMVKSATTADRRAGINDLLRGRFSADIEEWNYQTIHGRTFSGELVFTPGELSINGTTHAMGGNLTVDGDVYFGPELRIEGAVAGAEIGVKAFFEQGNNFGQDVLTADNLRGRMTTRLHISAALDSLGNFNYDALNVLGYLNIRDGELRDFKMLDNFAFALKSGDLKRVRFTELQNYFEITGRTIFLPTMTIRSSALNLQLAGTHTFDQAIDYHVKVNAGQAMANKLARHDAELEILPDSRGWFNLYYTLAGPVETFSVVRDRRGVKAAFVASEGLKRSIRTRLNRAFLDEELGVGDFLRGVGW